jgi:hypothetical protein
MLRFEFFTAVKMEGCDMWSCRLLLSTFARDTSPTEYGGRNFGNNLQAYIASQPRISEYQNIRISESTTYAAFFSHEYFCVAKDSTLFILSGFL